MKCGICILAGGLSSRMGRDKSRLRLGSRAMLGHVRASARKLGLPVRVIRRDVVPLCGPLGGVYTGLKTSRWEAELFLACDMPLVSPELLLQVLRRFANKGKPVFVAVRNRPGFPFLLPCHALAVVENQMAKKEFSIQCLARTLEAGCIRLPAHRAQELANINTPLEWRSVRRHWPQSRRLPEQARRKTA